MKGLEPPRPVALGARLKRFPEILTLGFRPNFQDYTQGERTLLLGANPVLYPTAFYADLFNTMGKRTFPSYHTYKFALDKIRQTALFQMQHIPHPRTRIFYGKQQKARILDHFKFPFIAKIPRGSARGCGVFRIETPGDLRTYLDRGGPAYIQEYLPLKRDMRVIVIGKEVALAYWRHAPRGDFRTNLSQGGAIDFKDLPPRAIQLALDTALGCGWDDVGIDIVESETGYQVLEANVKYGTQGFQAAGIPYKEFLRDKILNGEV